MNGSNTKKVEMLNHISINLLRYQQTKAEESFESRDNHESNHAYLNENRSQHDCWDCPTDCVDCWDCINYFLDTSDTQKISLINDYFLYKNSATHELLCDNDLSLLNHEDDFVIFAYLAFAESKLDYNKQLRYIDGLLQKNLYQNSVFLMIKKAHMQHLTGQSDVALRILNDLLANETHSLFAFMTRAKIYVDNHHHSLAMNDLTKILSIEPHAQFALTSQYCRALSAHSIKTDG